MKIFRKILFFLLILSILSLSIFSLFKLTNSFKNWNKEDMERNMKDIFKNNKTKFKATNTKTGKDINFSTNENLNFTDGITFRALDENKEEYEASSFSFKVLIKPENALNKDFTLKITYKDTEETPKEVKAKINKDIVTLTCLEPFDKQINVEIISKDNKDIKTNIVLDFFCENILTEEKLDNLMSYLGYEKESQGVYINKIKIVESDISFYTLQTNSKSPILQYNSKGTIYSSGYIENKRFNNLNKEKYPNLYEFYYHFRKENNYIYNKDNTPLMCKYKGSEKPIDSLDDNKLNEKLFKVGFFEKQIENNSYLISSISKAFLEKNPNFLENLKDFEFNISYTSSYPQDKKLSFNKIKIKNQLDIIRVNSLSTDIDSYTFK